MIELHAVDFLLIDEIEDSSKFLLVAKAGKICPAFLSLFLHKNWFIQSKLKLEGSLSKARRINKMIKNSFEYIHTFLLENNDGRMVGG